MNIENIGKDCPCYEVDCSDIMFDIGEFCGLPPNNGKLTIQVNGSTVGDFSANQQEDETINITTPTSQDIADAVAGEALLRQQADNTLQANIDAEELARQRADREIQAVLDGESLARVNGDKNLQSQIDAIASKSDVVDVVGTYAELQAYDTSKLNDNDVVKVLDDSTHNDAMTYYRWNKTTQTWSYIGQESPYYSKSQMDTLLATKQDNLTAGTGITLNGSTISADTTVLAEKSELSNYAEKANTYTKTEVDNLVEPKLSVEVVEQLQIQGEENKLYLTPKAHTTQTATGNPITATITDDAGQIEDFQLDGDTFQQSYSGKNILNCVQRSGTSQGITCVISNTNTITVTGKSTTSYADLTDRVYTNITAGTFTFVVSQALTHRLTVRVYYDGGYDNAIIEPGDTYKTFTMASDITGFYVYMATGGTGITFNETFTVQIVAGSTPDYDFEPYVGGIASPNPSYPQPIQVVTGEQTVSINGTDYPISLGSIELCKLGTYQDYIWKDGDTWKVHKATFKHQFDGIGDNWNYASATHAIQDQNYSIIQTGAVVFDVPGVALSREFTYYPNTGGGITSRIPDGCIGFQTTGQYYATFRNDADFISKEAAIAWLRTNKPTAYWALATATDTEITDATLISQLNAIASASLENGSNTITNTATGSNLAGDMEVDYFGYDPTNRYDKWLWLDINNAYEKLGS